MINIKALAGKQIGASKYPEKKQINLYQKERKRGSTFCCICLPLFGVLFLVLFLKFGIIEPLHQAERAELLYQRYETQLALLQEANEQTESIQAEYAHYGNDYPEKYEKNLPDRLFMLNTLKTDVFPFCKQVPSVLITEDQMELRCILPTGMSLSRLLSQVESNERVRYVTVQKEATAEQMDSSGKTAQEKEVNVSMIIYFQTEGKERNKG